MKNFFLAVVFVALVCGLAIATDLGSGIDNSQEVVIDTTVTAGVYISTSAVSEVEVSTFPFVKKGARWQVTLSKESDCGIGVVNLAPLQKVIDNTNGLLFPISLIDYGFDEGVTDLIQNVSFASVSSKIETGGQRVMIGKRNGVCEIGFVTGQWSAETVPQHKDYHGHIGNPRQYFMATADISAIKAIVTSAMLDVRLNLNAPENGKRRIWTPFVDIQAGTLRIDISGRAKLWGDEYTGEDGWSINWPIIPVQYEFSAGDPVFVGKIMFGMDVRLFYGLKVGMNVNFRCGNAFYWLTRTGDDKKVIRLKIEDGLESGAVVSAAISYEF